MIQVVHIQKSSGIKFFKFWELNPSSKMVRPYTKFRGLRLQEAF